MKCHAFKVFSTWKIHYIYVTFSTLHELKARRCSLMKNEYAGQVL